LKGEREGQPYETASNEEKSAELHKTFFPPPPQTSNVPEEAEYPPPICSFENITDEQVHRAIAKLKPYKAVQADDIANVVLKQASNLIVPFLGPIYRATFTLNTYPQDWKTYDSVVLRKPGRADYTVAKSYRPIVLLKTLGKPLSMAVTEDLTYITEKYELLPPLHFGARPGRTTTDAIHTVVRFVQDAWRVGTTYRQLHAREL
jgi:hypothetical protein